MLTNRRKTHILDCLHREGQAIAKIIATDLGVSEDTIRRDMRDMAAEGLVKRVHGGVMPVSPELPDLSRRQVIATDEKAARAVALVRPGQTIFLDGGTTTAAIADALPRDMVLTVATHSPTIAAALEHHLAEVILVGGRLYKHSMVAVGTVAAEAIGLLRPDIFFVGATAVHPVHGLTTGDFEEAAIKRRIVERSAATYLPATADKLDLISPCRILPLEGITGLIVSAGLSDDVLAPYRAADVQLLEGETTPMPRTKVHGYGQTSANA